ncbi:MAG: hypothetical protein IT385_22340 [Deltaproteobacteria bacterium]|nr:hypothetical protein [Deltaproteobacteria bacterium]
MRKIIVGVVLLLGLGGVAFAGQLKKELKQGGIKVVATSQPKDRSGGEYIQVVADSSNRKDDKVVRGRVWFIKGGEDLEACEFEIYVPAAKKEKVELKGCTSNHPEGMNLIIDSVEAPAPPPEPEPMPEEPMPDEPLPEEPLPE